MTILVALDGSSRAAGVLRAAMTLARRCSGRLLLFRAVGLPVEVPPQALSMAPDALGPVLRAQAHEALTALSKDLPPELFAGVRVSVGTAWQAICEAANHEKVDLIIIGSHGYGVLDRFLGTTAAKVVNHADRSVLVIRGDQPFA